MIFKLFSKQYWKKSEVLKDLQRQKKKKKKKEIKIKHHRDIAHIDGEPIKVTEEFVIKVNSNLLWMWNLLG